MQNVETEHVLVDVQRVRLFWWVIGIDGLGVGFVDCCVVGSSIAGEVGTSGLARHQQKAYLRARELVCLCVKRL